jgi:hypothetical protein
VNESRRRRTWVVPALVVAVVLVAVASGDVISRRPGVPEQKAPSSACVYSSHSISALNRFSVLVGREMTCAVVFNDAAPTWDALLHPWFMVGNFTDHRWDTWATAAPGRQLIIAQSLIPSGAPADWRRRGAHGDYDAAFRQLGRDYVAAGLGSSVIRLAHEGNGDWFLHRAGQTTAQQRDWARYWARVARILHRTPGGHFALDLTISAGQPILPLEQWYPGDAAVDIIGVDQHDFAPKNVGTRQPARWLWMRSQRGGVEDLFAFARRHGKQVSVPEWGLTNRAGYGAGDDAYYVSQMLALFARNHVRYQGFWDKSPQPGELRRNPRSLRVYRSRL